MALDGAWNAYIFRDGKVPISSSDLLNQFVQKLLRAGSASSQDRNLKLELLLRSGELESALADDASPQVETIVSITDQLAEALLGNLPIPGDELARACNLVLPTHINLSPPEGFAYYSLHPLDFSDLLESIRPSGRFAAVIGIRSIGTTLSAIVKASSSRLGIHAERITVRPAGHPYDRKTEFSPDQLRWIASLNAKQADFFIVDEGPGISGSSFLSVGDALLAAGVSHSRIVLLGSRNPDPATLTAPNAAQRWAAFRSHCTSPTKHLPSCAKTFVSGGIWRSYTYPDPSVWPASWLQMERLKFLSAERDLIFKFEGYGRFGQAVHDRAVKLADAGFGPVPTGFEEGFGIYPLIRGSLLQAHGVSPEILKRMATYCAFRAGAFAVTGEVNHELENMLRTNVEREFGVILPSATSSLRVVKPVIADGRMSPHKWLNVSGTILKLDNCIHGDDHFFPGPTDIAWDLAGAIVEWELDPQNSQWLLDEYGRSSGDNIHPRVQNYLLAYAIFRTAYFKMASASMEGAEEESRLVRAYLRYRSQAQRILDHVMKNQQIDSGTRVGGLSSEQGAA